MSDLPLASHINRAQQLLIDLRDRFSTFSPDCQDTLCAELDRFSENLIRYLERSQELVRQESYGKHPSGSGGWSIPVQETETQVGVVLRKANAGVFIRDLVNETITWSPELYELLGIDPAEPSRSERFLSLIHPADYPRVTQDTQAAIRQGGPYAQEFRIIRPDGNELWLSSIGYVEHDAGGHPLSMTGINQDITERKQAEKSLAQVHEEVINERNRLLAMMEALPIGVAIYDRDGQIVQSNPSFVEIWGGPRTAAYAASNQIDNKAWWVESRQPVRKEEWASSQAVRTGKTVKNQFLEIERFDGAHEFVLNSAAPIFDAAGKIAGCVVAMRDITASTRVENALRKSERSRRESEGRLRVVLSSLPITVFMLDRDLRYTWVYNLQHGMTAEDMLGKRDEEINPQVSKEHIAALRMVIDSGQSLQCETGMELFGEKKVFLMSYEPFRDLDDTTIGIIGAALDVTDQRHLEEEHRAIIHQVEVQRQIVENREKERQEIAREIHDGPIQTLVSLMFDLQLTKDSLDQREVLEELDQVSTKLKGAVRELRDVVNNLRPPALLRFGLGKSLQIYLEDFRARHAELELELRFDLPDDHIYFTEETTLSLYRLCQEGLNNIARHAQATKAHIRFAQEGENILLEIFDNGKGFAVPKDLFRKTKEGHFGLVGMKERVQAIGGEFRITSHIGDGTRIEVMVPVEQTIPAVG